MKDGIGCKKCTRLWQVNSEQAISIEKHGECIVCKFTPQGKGSNNGTKEQLNEISAEYIRRNSAA